MASVSPNPVSQYTINQWGKAAGVIQTGEKEAKITADEWDRLDMLDGVADGQVLTDIIDTTGKQKSFKVSDFAGHTTEIMSGTINLSQIQSTSKATDDTFEQWKTRYEEVKKNTDELAAFKKQLDEDLQAQCKSLTDAQRTSFQQAIDQLATNQKDAGNTLKSLMDITSQAGQDALSAVDKAFAAAMPKSSGGSSSSGL